MTIFLAAFLLTGWAGELDSASEKALRSTQDLLLDPKRRKEAISNSPEAQKIDAMAKELAGSDAMTEALYDSSASILEEVIKRADGDPQKAMNILSQAKDNPKAFFDSLSPKSKQEIHSISQKITPKPSQKALSLP